MLSILRLIRSETSQVHVYAGTLIGTAVCVAVAVFADSFNFAEMSTDHFRRALATDILLPIVIGGPFFYFLLEKIRQLAVARLELQHLASTDSLTAVLNRGAFVMLVEAYLEKAAAGSLSPVGSLLIVDADHFKQINDEYGHQSGDRALKLIASTIRGTLTGAQIVGRIGGEEFAVFLPDVQSERAYELAETIRRRVGDIIFPEGTSENVLSVSIGGASFSKPESYKEIFKIADIKLYEAKSAGRNLVRL